MNDLIGKFLYFLFRHNLWRRPTASTGIGGELTYGYGRLDGNGYWQFPAPKGKEERL